MGLAMKQVDYMNAFVQANLKETLYVDLPKDFHLDQERELVLKLKKSLYGLSQVPLAWFE